MNHIDDSPINFWPTLFMISLGNLLFTYFIYPILLKAFGYLKKPYKISSMDENQLPEISFIVAAYNEEDILEDKILNFGTLDYPQDKIEVLIGSDGSQDKTNEILRNSPDYITGVVNELNQGKAAVLNQLVQMARGEILIFCDANTMLERNTLLKLVHHFQNPNIGCVSGRLILRDSGDHSLSEGESIYWRMESEIKRLESDLGALMGVNGALYSIRKDLFKAVPTNKPVMDDFWVCIQVLLQNHQVIYETAALGVETTSADSMGEFKRKVRIGQANFNYLFNYLALLRPWVPIQAFTFLGHKLSRWFAPHFLLLLLLSSLMIDSPITLSFAFLQIAFYLLAYLGYLTEETNTKIPFSKTAYYFSIMNLALLIGFFQSFNPGRGGGWERVARHESN